MSQSANPFAARGHEYSKARRSRTAGVVSCIACWALLLPVLFILSYVLWHAFPAFSVDYFFKNPIDSGKAGGLWGALIGTFYLVITSLCIAVPVGVLSGIYLHEYAKDTWLTRAIGMAVTSLAGVPSIVHALFGYAAFVLGMLPFINSAIADPENRATMWEAGLLTAAMTIAVMELPLIITSTREALGAVPKAFREACWNLGASKWQTIRTVVLPNSLSGILTGVILSVSRAAGETAPILFTGAAFSLMLPETFPEMLAPYALGDPFLAMAYHLKIIAAEVNGMPDSLKFACAAVMIMLILTVNSTHFHPPSSAADPQVVTLRHMSIHIAFHDVSVRYGQKKALDELSFTIPRYTVFGVVGPSNSGKTTMLKCINRTIDLTDNAKVAGSVKINGEEVRDMKDVYSLRRRIGVVFPLPVGLPMSVYDNVAYAPRRMGISSKQELDTIVERCLRDSVLWDEVKDRMDLLGTRLSGGQQQRLTLARALSLDPEILCLDEFSIAIDPVTTMKIEEVLTRLKSRMTIILVTNLTQQARRMADHVAFINNAELVEWGETKKLFTSPEKEITGRYLNGEFG